jgi:hypothetical protein
VNAGAQVIAPVRLSAPAAADVALSIASSDTSKLTVSPDSLLIAAGEVQGTVTLSGLAVGAVDVSASAVSGTVGTQSAHVNIVAAAADNTHTSEMLIQAALDAGQLTAEQALVYRTYAAYGWPSLPAQYRGRVDGTLDRSIRTDLNQQWPTLSLAAKTSLVPFLMPPIYAGSWGDPAVRDAATVSVQTQRTTVAKSATRAAAIAVPAAATPSDPNPCSTISEPLPNVLPGWGHLDTDHFRIWYRTVDIHTQNYPLSYGPASAANIGAIAENVYNSEVSVMGGRKPLPDTNVACNGGDSRLDVYMDKASDSMAAQVVAYPGGCNQSPAYMWMSPGRTLDLIEARDLFAHEFLHMIQFSYAKAVDCNQYGWVDEGTAEWAVDYVYHHDDPEHSSSNGYFNAEVDNELGISVPLDAVHILTTNYARCVGGYCTYPLFEYATRKSKDDSIIGKIYAASEQKDPIASLEAGMAGGGSLRDVWHDFSLAGLNDWKARVANDFFQFDLDPAGYRTSIFDPKLQHAVLEAKLNGAKQKDLTQDLESAFDRGSVTVGNRPIYRLSNRVVDIKFSDPAVSFIQLVNPAGGVGPSYPGGRRHI